MILALLLVWVGLVVALYLHCLHRPSVGLVLASFTTLWINHFLAATLYLLDWEHLYPPATVETGLRTATLGLVAWSAGALLVGPMLLRWVARRGRPSPDHEPDAAPAAAHMGGVPARKELDPATIRAGIVGGLASYFLLFPLLGGAPSVTAILSSGLNLAVAGISMGAYTAWRAGDRPRFLRLLAVVMLLPLATVLTQGFLGYGTVAAIAAICFLVSYYRPARSLLLAGVLLAHPVASLYVTYMRDRSEIRATVWHGEGITERVGRLVESATSFEAFDPRNEEHLRHIDARLNQNYLLGMAIARIDGGWVSTVKGETLIEAVVALIPRAIWLGKPAVAGSASYVSRFTGLDFDASTSVGMGTIFELYINFGLAAVLVGMTALGTVSHLVDRAAADRIVSGDASGALRVYGPGLSLLQTGGSLAEVGASCLGAYLLTTVITRGHRARTRRVRRAEAVAGEARCA